MNKYEKITVSLIIIFGIVVGYGILCLGKQVVELKTQIYIMKMDGKNGNTGNIGTY